jgi:exopolyphosphatase / guanosine-5'-triphosphate,3'-diphosphate pyrophosphatase
MMSEIIPRWEWRSFGTDFGNAEARLKARGTDKLQYSDEIYLLSSISDANVKIRDGLMDIKRLEQTDTHGFEQWRPVLKEAFPLAAAAVGTVFAALGVASSLESTSITLEQLLVEVASDSRMRTLEVHKARTRYQLEGCMAELTEVTANGKTIRTMAVESEDPACIAAALRALGLEGVKNVSYPCGLKRLVKMTD